MEILKKFHGSENNQELSKKIPQSDNPFRQHLGGILSHNKDEIIYAGIIDIFTPYGWKKYVETSIKGLIDNVRISLFFIRIVSNFFLSLFITKYIFVLSFFAAEPQRCVSVRQNRMYNSSCGAKQKMWKNAVISNYIFFVSLFPYMRRSRTRTQS